MFGNFDRRNETFRCSYKGHWVKINIELERVVHIVMSFKKWIFYGIVHRTHCFALVISLNLSLFFCRSSRLCPLLICRKYFCLVHNLGHFFLSEHIPMYAWVLANSHIFEDAYKMEASMRFAAHAAIGNWILTANIIDKQTEAAFGSFVFRWNMYLQGLGLMNGPLVAFRFSFSMFVFLTTFSKSLPFCLAINQQICILHYLFKSVSICSSIMVDQFVNSGHFRMAVITY